MGLFPPELVKRYSVVHRPKGPRIQLALAWFVGLLIAFFIGSGALAVFFGAQAAIAALQVCKRWGDVHKPSNPPLAAAAAGLMPLAAWFNNTAVGLVLLVFVALSIPFGSGFVPPPKGRSGESGFDLPSAIGSSWITVAAGFIPGLAAAAVVQVHRIDAMSLVFLAAAVCTYDAGDHLCSAGYASRSVGPLSGMFGVAVVTAVMAIIQPSPLSGIWVWFTGLVLALCCPAGQWLGSWMLPRADSSAPALRRLDGWFVAAPVFWVIVALAS